MKKHLHRVVAALLAATFGLAALCACQKPQTPNPVPPDPAGSARLTFYAVNDLHGKFIDTAGQPGVDEFTAYMKRLYDDPSREEVLLSSGDMWQGTVESSTTKGKLMTEWMNEVGFVSMTLGNHEYDWGADVLGPNSELAEFPFLAINVTQDGQPVSYCQPSTVVERDGLKIGIIGAIGDCLGSISGDFKKGLRFATGDELTALVEAESARLRSEEGCGFIVYSIHEGGDSYSSSKVTQVSNADIPYYDTALSDGAVDLVFEAHSHKAYILQDEYGVYHLQGGGENSGVSCADVVYHFDTKQYEVTPRIVSASDYSENYWSDASVEEIYSKYFPDSDPYKTVLGKNSSSWSSNAIAEQVARLYYEKGTEVWGEEYSIVLGGGYLKTRSPYSLAKGNVTYADVFSILPFDNQLVLGSIKGSDLRKRFLSDRDNYHCYSTISTSAVSDNATYYIIVDSYTSTYSSNNITEIARLQEEFYARDLLAEYIAAGKRA